MLCKKTIERGRLWHCCNLFAMVMADGLQLKGFHLWGPFLYLPQNGSVCVALLWNVRSIIGRPSAAKWQTVSSRRGRFIVPAYMNVPTKWGTETHI